MDTIDMTVPNISEIEFTKIRNMLFDASGINLSNDKKMLVISRLSRRLNHYDLNTFSEYIKLISSSDHSKELRMAIDLMTTNETYFFREPQHFSLLEQIAQKYDSHSIPLRVWSAASSTGQEAYSIAMVLAENLKSHQWEVFGSDINESVVEKANSGIYPIEQKKNIPKEYLYKYCRQGIGSKNGNMQIDRTLRRNVKFKTLNLNTQLPELNYFDIIFLRNVLIYFNKDTKQRIVNRVSRYLKPGGYFLVSHSETLNDIESPLRMISPSIYCLK